MQDVVISTRHTLVTQSERVIHTPRKNKKSLPGIITWNRKLKYAENMAGKYDRMAQYSLDEDNQRIYKAREQEWNELSDNNVLLIKNIHKSLLRFSKEENNSDEVACIIDLKNNKSYNFVKGDRHSADILADSDAYHLLSSNEEKTIMICHNHPGLTSFSAKDINASSYIAA